MVHRVPKNFITEPDRIAWSLEEFCVRNGFSLSMYYVLRRRGQAPAEMRIGTRRLISVAAEQEWQRAREAAA
jgi:hypothetical protein